MIIRALTRQRRFPAFRRAASTKTYALANYRRNPFQRFSFRPNFCNPWYLHKAGSVDLSPFSSRGLICFVANKRIPKQTSRGYLVFCLDASINGRHGASMIPLSINPESTDLCKAVTYQLRNAHPYIACFASRETINEVTCK